MIKTLINIFRVSDLRNKVLFTLLMLAIFRIGHLIPIPGFDQEALMGKEQRIFNQAKAKLDTVKKADKVSPNPVALKQAQDEFDLAQDEYNKFQKESDNSAAGKLRSYVSLFSGGNLSQGTVFGLGVMPYISASIIFQLLGTVMPSLEKLAKEGESGRRKIQEWTRYATVPIAALQAWMWINSMGPGVVQSTWSGPTFWVTALVTLTTGCVFLMWIGEQIDEYGLGQGTSLIIMAGILCRIPSALGHLYGNLDFSGQAKTDSYGAGTIIALAIAFVFVIATAILVTQAQRRVPIMQAKHVRGRKVMGGSKQFLPLKVNIGGVMPVIFAQSLMLFPSMGVSWIHDTMQAHGANSGAFFEFIYFLRRNMAHGQFLYVMTEMAMIFFFAFFWTTVQFKPKEIANNLRDYGSFIPGLRPGKRTADYLEKLMMRMTYVGAAFLCLIAVLPTIVFAYMHVTPDIAQFLGGTGLLIVVSVVLDMVQRIETNLLTRNYAGFLGAGEGGKRIKGRQF